LLNPYTPHLTLDGDFLAAAALTGVITDSHFRERDRVGRLLAFLARLTNLRDGLVGVDAARGIGVDQSTAVGIDKGIATRLAAQGANGADLGGSVYFCDPRLRRRYVNVAVR